LLRGIGAAFVSSCATRFIAFKERSFVKALLELELEGLGKGYVCNVGPQFTKHVVCI
jgi:hypothetical protein